MLGKYTGTQLKWGVRELEVLESHMIDVIDQCAEVLVSDWLIKNSLKAGMLAQWWNSCLACPRPWAIPSTAK